MKITAVLQVDTDALGPTLAADAGERTRALLGSALGASLLGTREPSAADVRVLAAYGIEWIGATRAPTADDGPLLHAAPPAMQ